MPLKRTVKKKLRKFRSKVRMRKKKFDSVDDVVRVGLLKRPKKKALRL